MKRPSYKPENQEVREHKRYHFTVTPIKDLPTWKAEQARKDAEWEAGRAARYAAKRERAIAIIEGRALPPEPSKAEQEELKYRETRAAGIRPKKITWEDIQAKKASLPKDNLPIEVPKKSWFQRVKQAVINFCKAAFPQ